MSVERRKLPATDLEVSALGIDLSGPLPPHAEGVLHRSLKDGVNLFRMPLGESGRGARRLLRRAESGSAASLVLVGVPPPEAVRNIPALLTEAGTELSVPHRTLIEVRASDLAAGHLAPLPDSRSASGPRVPTVGLRVDPPYDGRVRVEQAAFVSVPHSLWEPAVFAPPDPLPKGRAAGILALDPWPGPIGTGSPRLGPDGSGPSGPVPITRLREETHRLIEFTELVRVGGRPLPEIAVRYALDTPGVSAALLPLPTPELWATARRAAENRPLSAPEQEWIVHHARLPPSGSAGLSDREQR
ncbi:MAG: hypothetical protein ACYCPN_00040 [Thermoplasmata archaeon]